MKKIILSLALATLLSTTTFAQNALVDNAVKYEQVKVIKEKSEAKSITKDGITQYTASNGAVVKIGDKFRINRPEGGSKTFVSITNKPTVMDMLGNKNFSPTVDTSMSNTEITIKSLYIIGTKKTGFKSMAELATCGTCSNLLVDIELAIETKEIRTNGMTSEDAIALLKAEKEKLDLGIITQKEFDEKKAELIKFIQKG